MFFFLYEIRLGPHKSSTDRKILIAFNENVDIMSLLTNWLIWNVELIINTSDVILSTDALFVHDIKENYQELMLAHLSKIKSDFILISLLNTHLSYYILPILLLKFLLRCFKYDSLLWKNKFPIFSHFYFTNCVSYRLKDLSVWLFFKP